MGDMKVNLCEIHIDQKTKQKVLDTLSSGQFVKGKENVEFEKEFASYVGTRYAVAVQSGTSAIHLALIALGLKPRDDVMMPSFTFVATATPVVHLGGRPVFADIDMDTYTISTDDVRRNITKRTKAIVPVHLYGHPANMRELCEIAEENDIPVLEDACQAHGALCHDKKVGSIGNVGCFSFYPSKNMTVAGDGGMVTTDSAEIAEQVSMLRDAGRKEGDKYCHDLVGFNFRLSEVHAAVGRMQLQDLEEWIEKRRMVASMYRKGLSDVDRITLPREKNWARHVYYVYTIRCRERDKLQKHLKEKGVSTGIYYPIPVHQQPCMKGAVKQEKLKNTETCAIDVLSLPMHPWLKENQIGYVIDAIRSFYRC